MNVDYALAFLASAAALLLILWTMWNVNALLRDQLRVYSGLDDDCGDPYDPATHDWTLCQCATCYQRRADETLARSDKAW